MKREHYYIRTVELVLIFALVLYNVKTWLDHRFVGDGKEPGVLSYVHTHGLWHSSTHNDLIHVS
jgi:hypothetical protein